MEALNLFSTKVHQIAFEKIPRFLIGQIDYLLDFIGFFSPFVLWQTLRQSKVELINVANYLIAIMTLLIALIFIALFSDYTHTHPYLFLTAPVIINALYGGLGPALFTIVVGVLISNLISHNFILSPAIFSLEPVDLAFILESLFISWISITQKRRQQDTTVNLIHEQTARLRAQSASLNLKRLERQKDDFIAIAAHELKNPLASSKAFTQIMKTNAKSKIVKQYLTRLETQINRLDQMVNQLFDVSSMTAGRMELNKRLVNFDELVLGTIIDLQHTILSHHLVTEGHTKAEIWVDPDRIREVIVNLVTNAIKYSPGADKVIIHLESNNQQVVFSVRDFGEGIAPADQKRIFERFYRAESYQVSGLGLGLYIVSEIVKLHGGKIWLNSQLGKGSTFFVSLPK